MRHRQRLWGASAVVLVAVLAGTFLIRLHPGHSVTPSWCTFGAPAAGYRLDLEQAANAATIAAVGARRGLPDHAATVALATALQESKLRNLPYGDRDSLGLFQQRPSQGWGTRPQILNPVYAAGQFFTHLERIRGWRTIPVAVAAQRVQHSADGSAYAGWELEARTLARALTGELAAGVACQFPASASASTHSGNLDRVAREEIGSNGLQVSDGNSAAAWLAASWLITHAYRYGVTGITLRGRGWTHTTAVWRQKTTVGTGLHYDRATGAP